MAPEDGMRIVKRQDGDGTYTLFYGGSPYLSNFHPSPFVVDGKQFVNGEQFFHYKKAEHFEDEHSQTAILRATEPRDHKRLGRKVLNYEQDEWNNVGYDYMKEGLRAKFEQNEELRKKLFANPDTTFVEASPRDRKWGIGLGVHNDAAADRRNWRGQNLLGQALTEIRDELLLQDKSQTTCHSNSTT